MIKHQLTPNFKLEMTKKIPAITGFAGLGLCRETMKKIGLLEAMKDIGLKQAGYGDDVVLEALILLLAAGGRCLSDWEYIKADMGFERIFGECPSVDTLERYLRRLDIEVPDRETKTSEGQVGYTEILERLHRVIVFKAYELLGKPDKLTLDLDATLIETGNSSAVYSYENTKAYQPMSVYCPELRMVVCHEFRDGNISPAEGYQRIVERCLELFPGVHFTVRSDSAGYQNDFMDWMSRERIRYYITADQTEALKGRLLAEEEWSPFILGDINTGQEVASIVHAPSAKSIKEEEFRIKTRNYIATRIKKDEPDLFGNYIYHVIVTNAVWESATESIKQYRGRCGTVEYAQQQIKSQCGMDMMPSNEFKVNAAWFSLGCLTHNLLRFIQDNLLPEKWKRFEFKTLRFRLIRMAAIVIEKSRNVILRICKAHPAFSIYEQARERLQALPV